MEKFFIIAISCARRQLDSEMVRRYLLANGLKMTFSPEDADYLFIFTCGVSQSVEDANIDCISNLKQFPGKLIVCGCLPAMNPVRIKSIFNGKAIATKDIDTIDEYFPDFKIKFRTIPDVNMVFPQLLSLPDKKSDGAALKRELSSSEFLQEKANNLFTVGRTGKIGFDNTFFSLRISEGCAGNCSFCNIKKAVGRLKSKPIPLILQELKGGIRGGHYRLNIVSSDSGSYGLDIHASLPELLEAILNEDERISIEFIQDLHPMWICRYKRQLIKLIKTKRIRSMLVPVESASSRVLKLMNRPTNLPEFKKIIDSMREVFPKLKLRTQVIVGFPTETEEDFQDTVAFIKSAKFDEVDIFAYHETESTDSRRIKPKVPLGIVLEREARMHALVVKK